MTSSSSDGVLLVAIGQEVGLLQYIEDGGVDTSSYAEVDNWINRFFVSQEWGLPDIFLHDEKLPSDNKKVVVLKSYPVNEKPLLARILVNLLQPGVMHQYDEKFPEMKDFQAVTYGFLWQLEFVMGVYVNNTLSGILKDMQNPSCTSCDRQKLNTLKGDDLEEDGAQLRMVKTFVSICVKYQKEDPNLFEKMVSTSTWDERFGIDADAKILEIEGRNRKQARLRLKKKCKHCKGHTHAFWETLE